MQKWKRARIAYIRGQTSAGCTSGKDCKWNRTKTIPSDSLARYDDMLEELKKIRTQLEPKPAPAALPAPKKLWAELMDFNSEYKVLGLAVGFIMGFYLGNLVQALVKARADSTFLALIYAKVIRSLHADQHISIFKRPSLQTLFGERSA